MIFEIGDKVKLGATVGRFPELKNLTGKIISLFDSELAAVEFDMPPDERRGFIFKFRELIPCRSGDVIAEWLSQDNPQP